MNIDKNGACCFTGYRPQKFPFPLIFENTDYSKFYDKLESTIRQLIQKGITDFYCGVAYGFDIMAAETVLSLKKQYVGIRLFCVIPFKNQAAQWNNNWKERYKNVLRESDETVVISEKYTSGVYQLRNCYMVDHSSVLLAYFDGKSGGTKNTINYAKSCGKKIINIASDDACCNVCDIYSAEQMTFI